MSDTAGHWPNRRRGAGRAAALSLAVLAAAPSWAAFLESPAPQAVVSGIGFISGWKCDASNITVRIDGGPALDMSMGVPRTDTSSSCDGEAHNGFIQQINWEHVGEGEHVAVAYDNGEEFSRSTFTVGSTGEQFVEEVKRRTTVKGFPAPGEIAVLEWTESTQHFELLGIWGGRAYEQGDWQQFDADLGAFDELGGLPYSNDEFLYAEQSDPDTCRAGKMTQAAKDRALEAMNQIRALHNLAPVHYSSRYDEQMQAAALIHAVGGGGVFSPPPTPAPGDQCYTEAGVEGSRTSWRGSRLGLAGRDPVGHMVELTERGGYIRLDRYLFNPIPPPERRWILNPFATYMSYGQVTAAGSFSVFYALKFLGFDEEPVISPRVEVDYVAFPYEIYPALLMEGHAPWSFSVVEDQTSAEGNQHPYFERAEVSVTRVEDGSSLPVGKLYTDTEPIGTPNILSWQVRGWGYDTLYEVEISNVSMRSGATRSFSYPVFIDRDDLEELTRTNREEERFIPGFD